MYDFSVSGKDKLENYERYNPSFAVFEPLKTNTDVIDNSYKHIPSVNDIDNSLFSSFNTESHSFSTPENTAEIPNETEEVRSISEALRLANESLNSKAAETKELKYNSSTSNRSLEQQLAAVESNGGDYKAFNPKGGGEGAVGKYQFRWTTWKPDIAKITGIRDKEEFMNNPEAQETYFSHYKKTVLIPQLRKIRNEFGNSQYSDTDVLKLLHFQGYEGLRKLMKSGDLVSKTQSYNLSPIDYLRRSK